MGKVLALQAGLSPEFRSQYPMTAQVQVIPVTPATGLCKQAGPRGLVANQSGLNGEFKFTVET